MYLAAPVLDRPKAVTAGQLWVMLAGPTVAKQRSPTVLRALGEGAFDFGERPEAANVIKHALNFLVEAMMEALAEAFTFAEKQGVARADLNDISRSERHHRKDDIRLPDVSAPRARHRRASLHAGRISAPPGPEGYPARAPGSCRPRGTAAHGRSCA
jgi:hypothetical protein